MNASELPIRSAGHLPGRLPYAGWVLAVIVLVYVCRLVPGARVFNQTVDEPYYIGSAVALYEAKTHILGVQHPPLTRLVIGLPLRLAGAALPEYRGDSFVRKEDPAYAAGAKVLFANDGRDYWRLLTVARCASLVFPVTALLYVFLLGRHLAGDLAGLGAALMLSLDATFLGHGLWCTTDAAATAGLLAALYHGLRYVAAPSAAMASIAAVALGLAISCKFSVALVVPGLLILFAVRLPLSDLRRHVPLAVGVTFFTLWATYLFHIGTLGASDTLAAAPQWDRLPHWIKAVPIPMPAFFLGLARLAAHSATGQATYFLGHLQEHPSRLYFPVLFLAKTPIALLVAIFTGLALLRKGDGRIFLACLAPAGIFLIASLGGGIQIGIRHILPAIALLYLPAAVTLSRRPATLVFLAAMCVLATIETAAQHPDYLSFYNVAAGGPVRGARIALDSNTDWGQDLARLGRAVAARELPPPAAIYPLGDRQAPLLSVLGLDPATLNLPLSVPGSLVAISRTRLALDGDRFPELAGLPEVARVGAGIAIYRIPPQPARPAESRPGESRSGESRPGESGTTQSSPALSRDSRR